MASFYYRIREFRGGKNRTPGAKQAAEKLSLEGHGFSRVPMSLRLTQGDENQGQIEWQASICRPATKDRVPHPSRFLRRVG